MIKVFYDPRQTAKTNNSFSPSAQKPAKVIESIKKLGIDYEVASFNPIKREDLYRIHSKAYVDGVLDLKKPNGFSNRLKEVVDALIWVSGSMTAAAKWAYNKNSITLSPTSGAHHAGYDFGGGFCTFNFLVLAALEVIDLGAEKIGIVDMDNHYGNGTADIIRRLKIDNIAHYTFGGDSYSRNTQRWLTNLPKKLSALFGDCDFIIYNAGVDSHIDDPLGGVLSTDELRQRDEIVFEELFDRMNKPIAISLAGGYQRDTNGDISKVLNLHNNTILAAYNYIKKRRIPVSKVC